MAKVELNHAELARILKSQGVRDELQAPAKRALAAAKSSAPVKTGAYQASLHIEQATTDRAVVRVVADVDYAMVVEAKHGTLLRALSAAKGS